MLGILALAFLLRAFKLTTLLPILVDESIYLRWAEIIDHQNQWFISLLDGKQPLTYWLLAIQRMIWDGDPLAGARLLSVFAGLGSTVGVFAVGRLWSNEIGGLIAGFLYACFPLSLLYDRLAYTEGFVNFLRHRHRLHLALVFFRLRQYVETRIGAWGCPGAGVIDKADLASIRLFSSSGRRVAGQEANEKPSREAGDDLCLRGFGHGLLRGVDS